MAVAEAGTELIEQVFAGGNRELRLLAARGLLPLAPDELIPVQVKLARDVDPEIAGRAATVLRLSEPRLVADYLAAGASAEELAYFAAEADQPEILETLIRRRDVPRRLLVELAPRLPPGLQEALILRQDAIVEEPAILDALEDNPQLDHHVLRRIGEYRMHLLPRVREDHAPAAPEVAEEEASDEEVAAALAEAVRHPRKGEVDEATGLSEGQIRSLPASVRLRLARGAPRTLRTILVRDNNPRVAIAVLVNSAMAEDEVEQIARSRVVVDEVLEEIARRREWTTRYGVVNALVANPRTPVGVSMRLLPRLGVRDLRTLAHSRNVPDAIRVAARNLFAAKTR
jgi:hypothetical protein